VPIGNQVAMNYSIRTSRETDADVAYNNIQHFVYLQYRPNENNLVRASLKL
jgi:hypothetical protein